MSRFGSFTKPALLTVIAGLTLAANILLLSSTSVVKAGNLGSDHKIVICHVPPGNPQSAHSIDIDLSAWKSGHSEHNSHSLDFKVDGSHTCPPAVTPTPTHTPKPTPSKCPKPSPTPTHTPKPTPTKKPCPTKTPSPTPKVTPTPTNTPEVTPTPTTQPEVTPTPTSQPEVTPTPEESAPQPCNGCGGWPSAPSCGATVPPAPILLSVTRHGSSATLTWSAVVPVTHYLISYGLKPDEFIYGVPNTGNVTTYTINSLDPKTQYYFSVRAVNDCAPSAPSGGIGGGEVLGASTLASTGNSTLLYLTLSAGIIFLVLSAASYRLVKNQA